MKKFAVVLAGCGVYDGAEIHEATLCLLAIVRNGAEYQCFAPDVEQYHVVNHLTGEVVNEKRNVLVESARIARGNVKNLKEFKASDYDAIILPGGFGVAKNLSTFAFKGADCEVNEELQTAIQEMLAAKKPIGAMCIAPAVVAKIIGNKVEVTIGQDSGTAAAVEACGAVHKLADNEEVVCDLRYKVFSTPCYMLNASIVQIAEGANNIVKTMLPYM